MSESMVERVDAAIAAYDATALNDKNWKGETHYRRGRARAVIAALREPTYAMVRAGVEATDEFLTDNDVREVVRALVDAALAEPAPPT